MVFEYEFCMFYVLFMFLMVGVIESNKRNLSFILLIY